MLGFLLARAGVQVLVLEKHSDFLRDFRGDYWQGAYVIPKGNWMTFGRGDYLCFVRK
jgi:2-polyprenyl-6-methoxyphenol hydroxylase-like FAD-dependent oxidoreductase